MKAHLHFTFGPVQSFVAQARRTRDLYAGSFLLSHLALQAMHATNTAGGKIILPAYDQLKCVAENPNTDHAIAPNRFVAEFESEDMATEAGRRAGEALQNAWKKIAGTVWERFVAPVAGHDRNTRDIWDRQISSFWNIAWVVGDEDETDLLDRRKNWHAPPLPVEGGDHCTLMGQWQELSGFIQSKDRKRQNDFWAAVRAQPNLRKLDLEDDERLCGIAFVKRFFPHVSKDAIGRELDMQNWPSTVSIAAVPWLRVIKDKPEVHAAAKAYADLVANQPGAMVSSARRITCFKNSHNASGRFSEMSGNFLNRTALENKRGTPLNDEGQRKKLVEKLRALERTTDDRAGNFYALLLMDGDRMGKLIREHTAQKVTPCLTGFASEIPALVENEKHSGICIYAGGDDLLAMLPLDHALEAVTATRQAYLEAFQANGILTATLSAGLVFAHYRCAFSRVLKHAHHLLDVVAKDGAGRDALAIGVLKPGGVSCQWAAKFNDFVQEGFHCFAPLMEAYRRGERNERDGLSSSFLYNLRERFGELFDPARSLAKPSSAATGAFDDATLEALFVAEYLHGRISKETAQAESQRKEAQQLMGKLIHVCRQPDSRHPVGKRFDFDGVRLVKFLALDGKEGME